MISSPDSGPERMLEFYVRIGIREGAKDEKSRFTEAQIVFDLPPAESWNKIRQNLGGLGF